MNTFKQILQNEITRCFRRAFTFNIDPIIQRSHANEAYDYICEVPEICLTTYKTEMLKEWGPYHQLFAKDIAEEILVHLDKTRMQMNGIDIIDRIQLNDKGHIQIYLSKSILEYTIPQQQYLQHNQSQESTIVLGPMISLGEQVTLTKYRSLCISSTLSRQFNAQQVIPIYQKNLKFCDQLYKNNINSLPNDNSRNTLSDKLIDFRDYLKLKEDHYLENQTKIMQPYLENYVQSKTQPLLRLVLNSTVVDDYQDILDQYNEFSKIIIVDHFERIKSIKENERIILWGHNYFGQEFKQFDNPLILEDVKEIIQQIKLQVLKTEPKRPHAFSEQNIKDNSQFLDQVNSQLKLNHLDSQFFIKDQIDESNTISKYNSCIQDDYLIS